MPRRIVRMLGAGAVGLLQSLVVVAGTVVLATAALQAATHWYATGTLQLLPSSTPAKDRASELEVRDATPSQRAEIRRAVSALRYRLPPDDVTIAVVEIVECPECQGAYVSSERVMKLQRSTVEQGGPGLQYVIAHETGHFVDAELLSSAERERFRELRDIPEDLSWSAAEEPWPQRPAEDFAEVFGALASPSVTAPLATAYGRVSNAEAVEDLLADAGVKLDEDSTERGWRPALEHTASFLVFTLQNRTGRRVFSALIAAYITAVVFLSMRDAWFVGGGARGLGR